MPYIVIICFVVVVLSYLGVGGYRAWAEKRQILDFPNDRSSHTLPTPRGGGLVIVLLTLIGIWPLYALVHGETSWVALASYTVGAFLIAAISWLDDLRMIPNGVKFSIQSLGAILAISGIGFVRGIDLPFLGHIHLGLAGAVLTVVWIVGLTNAYNFMDGIDGIAGGQALIAGLGWGVIGWLDGQPLLAALGLLVASSSLGFLAHNWYPARIFMGDVGSAFLGYTFAVLPLLSGPNAKDTESGRMLLGALLLWPFIFDTSFTLFRRLMRGENIVKAHKSHLYQRLATSGLSQQSVTLIYIGLAMAGLIAGEIWAPGSIRSGFTGVVAVSLMCGALWIFVVDFERRHAIPPSALRSSGLLLRKILIVLTHVGLLTLTYYASFLLRLDLSVDGAYRRVFLVTLPLVLLVKLPIFYYFRLFSGWWRYVGMSDLLDIIKAASLSAPVVYAGVYWAHGFMNYPRSIFLIDPILTVLVVGGSRFAVRAYTESARLDLARGNTLIVGAGRAGTAIARELKQNQMLEYNPVGFVDDDSTKKDMRILGIRVLGGTEELPKLIAERDVSQILIAMPSASGKQIQRILDKCRECKVAFKILPTIGDIISGSASLSNIRSVQVEDLLQREPVKLDLGKIRQKLTSKCVLITGAGGSIGSELARQIAGFNPGQLILFERAESDLYRVELELAELFPKVECRPVVGDILDVNRLREIFQIHRPVSVFHAAAFKHVPMMEKNCFQAVTNNIFGTYNVALVAKQCGVEDFVMISSDKAVNPANIMGVTKRISELIILGLQHHATRFVSVRFGNVLGSNGSVIPLFERQIARRKPITVTHAEATRYFMTIPEAVQLVLQASTMGNGGEIFVLDMGDPIKIVDLARSLIRLSGLEPEKDIPIIYTGLRPGEKLFEELRLQEEGIKPTSHEKIRVFEGGAVSFEEMERWLDQLAAIVDAKNVSALVLKLKEIVPEYAPSPEIISLAQIDRHDRFVSYSRDRTSLFRD